MTNRGAISPNLEAVLRLVRADIGLSQPQRVEELRLAGDPDRVIDEHTDTISFSVDDPSELISSWTQRKIGITTILDLDYPGLLSEVREAPAIIFWEGESRPDEEGVSVVGSRKASASEVSAAFEIGFALASREITVISGLAEGIDTAAHEGALAAGGRTVAVIGSGTDHTYPSKNKALRRRIVDQGGMILSQFFPDQRPSRSSFPMRNAVMSGYGVATLVVAAGEKSGTRHQAHAAVKHGRDVIFAGSVAANTSWAREMVNSRRAQIAHSAGAAVALASNSIGDREQTLSLF